MDSDSYECERCRYDWRTRKLHLCRGHREVAGTEAIAFDWARRWHIDYVPEGVAIPARPTVKPQPEPQPGVQLVRFPIQD